MLLNGWPAVQYGYWDGAMPSDNNRTGKTEVDMSDEKNRVDDNHYRVVSDDGKTSWLYESHALSISGDTLIEVAKHDGGTTVAYEPGSVILGDGCGKKK